MVELYVSKQSCIREMKAVLYTLIIPRYQCGNDIEAKTTRHFWGWAQWPSWAPAGARARSTRALIDSTHMAGNGRKTSVVKEVIPRQLRHDWLENETESYLCHLIGLLSKEVLLLADFQKNFDQIDATFYSRTACPPNWIIRPLWEDRFVY